jgi:hypothetical protein
LGSRIGAVVENPREVEMANDVEKHRSGGLRLVEGVGLAVVAVIGIAIAFAVVGAIIKLLWDAIVIVVVVAVVAGLIHLFRRRG